MKKLKNLIEHIFTKKSIKIFLLLFVFVGFFVGISFAQSNITQQLSSTAKLSHYIHVLISILSWGWIVFATLAGKFMTNDLVYGSFINLDKILWNLWNIMKNFANITLGCVLIFSIVKNLFVGAFGEKSPIQNVKDTVIHTLLAGVLIQMSRFLLAAAIDLSTIATVAVGSLPSQFISNNTDFQKNITSLADKSMVRLDVDLSNTSNLVDYIKTGDATADEINKFLDTITPSADSMVGPLMFLGSSVFDMYELSDSSRNAGGSDDRGDLLLSLGINGFVMVSFTLTLALMFFFNMFRVITLWIIIPLMPFVILLSIFKKEWSKLKLQDFLDNITDYSKVIRLIFKPVYMTLVLSIVLIVMVLVKSVIKTNGGDTSLHDNITVESTKDGEMYNSSIDVSNIANITLNMKKSFSDLLVYLVGLALMGMLMKSCFTGEITGIKFIDNKIAGMSNMVWGEKGKLGGIMGNMRVLPLGKDEKGNTVNVGFGPTWNFLHGGEISKIANRRLQEKETAQDDLVRQFWGIKDKSGDFDSLKRSIITGNDRNAWIKEAAEIGIRKGYTLAGDFSNNNSFSKALKFVNNSTNISRVGGVIYADDVVKKMKELKEEKKT